MRKQQKSEIAFLRFLENAVSRRLPSGWAFERQELQRPRLGFRPDATFVLTSPDGGRATVAVDFKSLVEPRMVAQIENQVAEGNFEAVLIGAPFLSPRARDLLERANLSYADLTGNLRLVVQRPAVYIEDRGARKDPSREPRPLKSLKGAAVARVVRALCDFRPPYRIGDLAKRSRASLPTASRVISFLEREALVGREGRSVVSEVTWDELIVRWTQDYSVLEANRVSRYLEPRGLPALIRKLATDGREYAVTGSFAAQVPGSVAPPRLAMIYVRDTAGLADQLDLRPAEAGANVLLLEPFDSVVFDRASPRQQLTCAAFSQVAADLLTSPGRGPAEGEELIRWMRENEGEWRV